MCERLQRNFKSLHSSDHVTHSRLLKIPLHSCIINVLMKDQLFISSKQSFLLKRHYVRPYLKTNKKITKHDIKGNNLTDQEFKNKQRNFSGLVTSSTNIKAKCH